MKKLDNLVQDFLAQKKIAVVGVSDKRDTGCNLSYKKFKENGYRVYAVNPRINSYSSPQQTRQGVVDSELYQACWESEHGG